jgi:uncharacterized membrane protein YoaK (UPF0700 family)
MPLVALPRTALPGEILLSLRQHWTDLDCTRLAKHTVDGSLGEWVGYFSLLAAYVAGVSCSRL